MGFDFPKPSDAEHLAMVLGFVVPALGAARASWQRAGLTLGWGLIGAGAGALAWLLALSTTFCDEQRHAAALVPFVAVGAAAGAALGRVVRNRFAEVLVAAAGAAPMAAMVAMAVRVALGFASTGDNCNIGL
jgi:hypothetical protein